VRTTIDLDEDVLRVAKSLARQRGHSLGRVVSEYFRQGLRGPDPERLETRNGIPLILRRRESQPVTPELVKELLESDE